MLFTYPEAKGDPTPIKATNINAYLVDGPNVLVTKRMKMLSPDLHVARFGSKPVDGGHLIVEASDYDEVIADPIAAKYLRPFMMGNELINNLPRWCLWLVDLAPGDVAKSAVLRSRLAGVRAMRAASKKVPTQALAMTPHLFGENHQPDAHYLGIPRVFSETRHWATCAYLPPEVIAGDKVYTCVDPDGFAFAIISSSMFITWQKTIGGRLESRCSFSNTVVWNNLPLPPVADQLRAEIITAGQGVLAARDQHPNRSLAEHYHPLAMDPTLIKAHQNLDKYVDRAFGATRPLKTNEERQAQLFTNYHTLTTS